ncbi:cytochrome P450 4C1 isoform X2 [Fopius arisanus]|uniref:Cytochrome P450 4C1 isoform X2 n=1 Tax=Fopius arisanus TaxID=64838 RepID=A0A9R1UC39_9HYME|nr:PREDICTED: cytochrome P450 4C1-like isoform X2 [Fopius arisanus]
MSLTRVPLIPEDFLSVSVLALIAGALAAVYLWTSTRSYFRRRYALVKFARSLPGPPTLPLLGNALEFAVNPEETFDRVIDIIKNNEKTFRFWLGPQLVVVLTDPRDYEIILGSPKASYKDPIYRMMEPAVGQGLVSGSGPRQRTHRKIVMPMLNGRALTTYLKCFNIHSHYCRKLMEDTIQHGEFDVLPFLTNCTTDMMLETIFGISGAAQRGGYKRFVHYSDRIYEFIHLRMFKIWLHPDFIFERTEMGEEQRTGLKIIHGIVDQAIARKKREHVALARGAITEERPRVMLLEQMIDHMMKNQSMDDLELRYQIYTVYIAAQDTIAVISSFTLLMLAMHPGIQEKVREEVVEVLGGSEDVEEVHLSDFKYLERVIRETLRLFPIAPLMVRRTTGVIELESCTIPENCSVVIAAFRTHRNEEYWDHPEEFNPDRFLPENCNKRHPFSYIPFSGGLRGCVGQKFAIICLKTIIANLVRSCRFETSVKMEEIKLKMDISIRSRCGYRMKIIK